MSEEKEEYQQVADSAFTSPTAMASRMRSGQQQWIKSPKSDDGTATTATSRRVKNQFSDPNAAAVLSSISGSTAIKKSPTKSPTSPKSAPTSPRTAQDILSRIASATGMTDAPPPSGKVKSPMAEAALANAKLLAGAKEWVQEAKLVGATGPHQGAGRPLSPAELKVQQILSSKSSPTKSPKEVEAPGSPEDGVAQKIIDDAKKATFAAPTVEQGENSEAGMSDLVSAVEKLVESKQSAKKSTEITALTAAAQKLAESKRSGSSVPSQVSKRSSSSVPSLRSAEAASDLTGTDPYVAGTFLPVSSTPPARKQLDLKHNDNAFVVIADLVLEPVSQGYSRDRR